MQVSVESLTVKSVGEAESAGLWGLDRIDQKTEQRDYLYHYSYVGTGVHVYTVDTVSLVNQLCTPSYGWHSESFLCVQLCDVCVACLQSWTGFVRKNSVTRSCDFISCMQHAQQGVRMLFELFERALEIAY